MSKPDPLTEVVFQVIVEELVTQLQKSGAGQKRLMSDDHWLTLPVTKAGGLLEMVVTCHGKEAKKDHTWQVVRDLSAIMLQCPLVPIRLAVCPDCLADRPCRAEEFLRLKQKLELRLGQALDPREMDFDAAADYGLNEAHSFQFVLHTHTDLAPEDISLPERLQRELGRLAPEFKVEGIWCPHCLDNQSHPDEQSHAA